MVVRSEYTPSALPRSIRKTVRLLTDVPMLQSAVQQSGLDLPLGRLDKQSLQAATTLLTTIKIALEHLTELKSTVDQVIDADAVRAQLEKIAELSSDFYELIPHREYNDGPVQPFSSADQIKTKSDMLQSLSNVQLGARLVSIDLFYLLYRFVCIYV